jgi:hypothetical protein
MIVVVVEVFPKTPLCASDFFVFVFQSKDPWHGMVVQSERLQFKSRAYSRVMSYLKTIFLGSL